MSLVTSGNKIRVDSTAGGPAYPIPPKSLWTLSVLRDLPDPSIDRLGRGMVEAALAMDPSPYWLWNLMGEVLLRHGDPHPMKRFEAISDEVWEITPKQLRRLWSEAKIELAIEDTAPFEFK